MHRFIKIPPDLAHESRASGRDLADGGLARQHHDLEVCGWWSAMPCRATGTTTPPSQLSEQATHRRTRSLMGDHVVMQGFDGGYVISSPVLLGRVLWWYGEDILWPQALELPPRAVAEAGHRRPGPREFAAE